MFHSTEFTIWLIFGDGDGGRSGTRFAEFATMRAVSPLWASDWRAGRSPRTQIMFAIQNGRCSRPRSRIVFNIGCWVRCAVSVRRSKTYRPLASLVFKAAAPLKSACSERMTRNSLVAGAPCIRRGSTLSCQFSGMPARAVKIIKTKQAHFAIHFIIETLTELYLFYPRLVPLSWDF